MIPEPVFDMMEDGADLVLSHSGGKDSQALTRYLIRLHREYGWTGQIVMLHCDLGRAEYRETLPFVHCEAEKYGVELVILHRELNGQPYDLFDGIETRRATLDAQGKTDKPHWPSSAARYCTKSWKEQLCDKWIRARWKKNANVVVGLGLRAEESAARAKKPLFWLRESHAPTLNRNVMNWLPIHDWSLAQVWTEIGLSLRQLESLQLLYRRRKERNDPTDTLERVFPAHVAYLRGNKRLSCAFCVLADEGDLRNGAAYEPETYRYLVNQELQTGFSFKSKFWLASLRPDLLTDEERERFAELSS